jgi:hypothetical protein
MQKTLGQIFFGHSRGKAGEKLGIKAARKATS